MTPVVSRGGWEAPLQKTHQKPKSLKRPWSPTGAKGSVGSPKQGASIDNVNHFTLYHMILYCMILYNIVFNPMLVSYDPTTVDDRNPASLYLPKYTKARIYQSPRNCGSIVYSGSCRIHIISSINPRDSAAWPGLPKPCRR